MRVHFGLGQPGVVEIADGLVLRVELAAAAKLAALGTPQPVNLGADGNAGASQSGKDILAKLEAITDPTERVRFYRANKEAVDAAYRAK